MQAMLNPSNNSAKLILPPSKISRISALAEPSLGLSLHKTFG
jgi:hypothetical protein